MKKVIVFILFTSLLYLKTFGQELTNENRNFAIGVKLGNPNIIGLETEYVFTKSKNLGINLDITVLPNIATMEDVNLSLYYGGIALNYYFLKPSHGLYSGLGYFHRIISHSKSNLLFESNIDGESKYSYDISSFKIITGYKLVFNRFLLKPEIGIGYNIADKTMIIVEKYPDGFERETEVDINEIVNQRIGLFATLTIGIVL